jgi:hypothetical protein
MYKGRNKMAENNRSYDGVVNTGKGSPKKNPSSGMNRQRSTYVGQKAESPPMGGNNVDTDSGGNFDGKGRAWPGK